MSTRDRILEAALELFRERGFDQSTMREIATRAGVATGAAYYYFESKDAIVMAFYARSQEDMRPRLEAALEVGKTLEARLRALIEIKLEYFAGNKGLLAALSSHIDPRHPLSPFSGETKVIRDEDTEFFRSALRGTKVPKDLELHLPGILWLYQMGVILFWTYDRSVAQARTRLLIDSSLKMITTLIRASSLPFLRPVRKQVVNLVRVVVGDEEVVG